MEFEITACAAFDVIPFGGLAHPVHCRFKSLAKLRPGRLRDLPDSQHLQLDSDVVNLRDVLNAKIGHPTSFHWSSRHETLILQDMKPFTNGGLADSHLSGQLALHNSFTRFQLASKYGLS